MLNYKTTLADYTEKSFTLKFEFQNPLSVSIGDKPDVLLVDFVEPELFTSKVTGKTLAPGTVI